MATRFSAYHRHQYQCRQDSVVENEEALLNYCATCNKRFSRKRDLHRHLRSARVHVKNGNIENGGYSCRMCAKVFTRQDSLQKHEGNKSCMKRYFQFLRGAGVCMDLLLRETPAIGFVDPTTPETDYYNSDTHSITTTDIQDDNSVKTPSSSLSTPGSFSTYF